MRMAWTSRAGVLRERKQRQRRSGREMLLPVASYWAQGAMELKLTMRTPSDHARPIPLPQRFRYE